MPGARAFDLWRAKVIFLVLSKHLLLFHRFLLTDRRIVGEHSVILMLPDNQSYHHKEQVLGCSGGGLVVEFRTLLQEVLGSKPV